MTWLAIVVCLAISFIFSGVEAGILSVNRVRLRHRVKQGDAAAARLQHLLAQPGRMLVTVLLVTNFMNICALLLVTQELVERIGRGGYLLAVLLALPIYLLGLELLPKSLFRLFPFRTLAGLSEPLRIADLLCSPLLRAGAQLLRLIVPRKVQQQKKLFVAREDFKYLTAESERHGTLSKVERDMINNVIDFRKVRAKDVMVPMAKVVFVRPHESVADLLRRSREHNMDRLPIILDNGKIIGLVNVFEVLVDREPRAAVSAYQRRIVTVSADEEAYHVIRKLRAARSTLAAVTEGDALPLGVVSLEDMISRLVKTAVATSGEETAETISA